MFLCIYVDRQWREKQRTWIPMTQNPLLLRPGKCRAFMKQLFVYFNVYICIYFVCIILCNDLNNIFICYKIISYAKITRKFLAKNIARDQVTLIEQSVLQIMQNNFSLKYCTKIFVNENRANYGIYIFS